MSSPLERKKHLTPYMIWIVRQTQEKGFTNRELAEMKNITIHAIRKQCGIILHRTGCSSIKEINLENYLSKVIEC